MKVFLVAGEHSGDQLGFKLMQALKAGAGEPVAFFGTGGEAMQREGMNPLFPLEDIAVMGLLPVLKRLPTVLARIAQTAAAVIATRPDVLVLIDSPDFSHRVARRVRKALPDLALVNYVSPTVWAWRPGRAHAMRAYVDHVLALLPFEPEAHRRLGGPDCTYVGHPLIERLGEFRPDPVEVLRRAAAPPVLLVLPGSRRLEIDRLMPVFGETLARVVRAFGPVEAVLPAVDHVEAKIRAAVETWPVQPRIVTGEAAKLAAFRSARAALAASGTVTLELGLAGVPMVVAYQVSWLEETVLQFLLTAKSFALPNLVLEAKPIPEFLQTQCTAQNLAAALALLLHDSPERAAQLKVLRDLDASMVLAAGDTPSARAAEIVLACARNRQRRPSGLQVSTDLRI